MFYRYTECGLENVYVKGIQTRVDASDGKKVVCIRNPIGLHRAIAAAIVGRAAGMSGKELRFLRTEMDMTQADLAEIVHRDAQTVGRWERGEKPMEGPAEALIRLLAIERLTLDVDFGGVADLSGRCVPAAKMQNIQIDGRDAGRYRLLAA